MPVERWAPVLADLAQVAERQQPLLRANLAHTFGRLGASMQEAATQARSAAELVTDPDRIAQALRTAGALDDAAARSLAAAQTTVDAPKLLGITNFKVASRHVAADLGETRAAVTRALDELAATPELAVPAWRNAPSADAATIAAQVADTRAAELARIAPGLTREELALARQPVLSGIERRVLGSRAVSEAVRVDVLGADRIPRTQNVILAPEHVSATDVGNYYLGHRTEFLRMSSAAAVRNPIYGPLIKHLGTIPVPDAGERSLTTTDAVRTATKALIDGRNVMIFPSGSVTGVPSTAPARRGAALLAIRTGTPVLPVGQFGLAASEQTFWGKLSAQLREAPRAAIAYGDPIPVHHLSASNPDDVLALTARIDEIQDQLSQLAREHVRSR